MSSKECQRKEMLVGKSFWLDNKIWSEKRIEEKKCCRNVFLVGRKFFARHFFGCQIISSGFIQLGQIDVPY